MPFASALLAIPLLLAQLGGNDPNEVVSRAGRVGITLERRGDVLVVSGVEPGSSAESVGMKVGDQVLRIDLDNTERISPSDAAAQLRGALGTRATLTVLPRAQMVPKRVDVLRDVRVYLANEDNRISLGAAAATPLPDPSSVRLLDASYVEATADGKPVTAETAAALGKSASDVATCIGALRDVLPEGYPNEFAATLTVKRDSISVRTEPPSGDLSSCLGRRAATWGLPSPGRKDPPLVTRATWRWVEERGEAE
jgi:hypothetical protein